MRLVRPFAVLSMLALAVAPLAAQQGNTAIARLEAARARNPQNAAALRALGIAYYKAQRYAEARPVLDQARRLAPKDGVSALYAGMAAEQVNDLTAARTAYETYLNVGTSRRAKAQISTRLVSLSRQEAVAAAKAAVANEARLSQTPSNPMVVAVPPLRFNGTDTTLKPLERGMAELLITDLSRSSRLTVVERDRMQAIADEIQLSSSDRVDAQTSVRAGRLIQAGSLVNGTIQQTGAQSVTLDASLVSVANGSINQAGTVSNSTLDRLFDAEKQLVLQIFNRIGVVLTPAERQLVDRRPTSNIQAFLAYSRGLQAQDDGRFQDAARYFESARSLDPGFGAASARAAAVTAAVSGAAVTTTTIESGLSGSESQIVDAAASGNTSSAAAPTGVQNALTNTRDNVNPTNGTGITQITSSTTSTAAQDPPRLDPTSNNAGTDRPNLSGQVIIVIRRP